MANEAFGGESLLKTSDALRAESLRARLLAFRVTDKLAFQRLSAYADELEARADALECPRRDSSSADAGGAG